MRPSSGSSVLGYLDSVSPPRDRGAKDKRTDLNENLGSEARAADEDRTDRFM